MRQERAAAAWVLVRLAGVLAVVVLAAGCETNRGPRSVTDTFAPGSVVPVAVPVLTGGFGFGRTTAEQTVILDPVRPASLRLAVRAATAEPTGRLRVLADGVEIGSVAAEVLEPGEDVEPLPVLVGLPAPGAAGTVVLGFAVEGALSTVVFDVVTAEVVIGLRAPAVRAGALR